MELWISLTSSVQTQWLEYAGLCGEMLLDEVRAGLAKCIITVNAKLGNWKKTHYCRQMLLTVWVCLRLSPQGKQNLFFHGRGVGMPWGKSICLYRVLSVLGLDSTKTVHTDERFEFG